MEFSYDAETDSLYISLKPGAGVETIEVADGLLADLDEAGEVVGLDIDHASRFDLSRLELKGLSLPIVQAA